MAVQLRISTKWLALIAALWIMLVAGGGYNFGLYSQSIKDSLGYSQKKISTIAFFRDIGANFGLHCGLVYDLWGPRVVLSVGACFNFVGYFVMWLIVTRKIADPGVGVVSLLFFILANSQAFGFTAAMITSVQNFPQKRGMIIGVVTSFVGMSGAVLALAFEAVYQQRTQDYLLFNSWSTAGVYMLCVPLLKTVDVSISNEFKKSEKKRLYAFSIFSFVIALYLFVVIMLKVVISISWVFHCVLTAILLLGAVATPWLIMLFTRKDDDHSVETSWISRNIADKTDDDHSTRFCGTMPHRGENFTVLQALRSLDMWIIIISSSCGIGSVLAALDNMGQIGEAWGYTTHEITNSVSFNNLWNFLGRIGAGWISEVLLQRYSTPRPLVFAATLVITAIGHLFIALRLGSAALMLASAFEGFALGALLTMIFTMTSELFGLKSFAKLYSLGTLTSTILGTCLLSVFLAGNLFDKASAEQHHPCKGVVCYRESFLIMVGVCIAGALLSVVLAVQTRPFYRKLASESQESEPGNADHRANSQTVL